MPQIPMQQTRLRLMIDEQRRQFFAQALAIADQFVVLCVSPCPFELRQQTLAGEEEWPVAMPCIRLWRTADEIVTVPAMLCALDAVQGR